MDHIRQAILKAKASRQGQVLSPALQPRSRVATDPTKPSHAKAPRAEAERATIDISPQQLEKGRIVAHLPHNPLSAGFSLLRTRVYQAMSEKGWRTIMVTSPTPGCGKTVMSINLAVGLARQPRCSAVLVDCDLRKPDVAKYLGYRPEVDLQDVLLGHAELADALQTVTIAGNHMQVIATRSPVPRPAEVLASGRMRRLVKAIREQSAETIAVFDVPPIAVADDVIAFLPEVDCVLLVLTPGESSYAQIEESIRSIPSEKIIGTVFTKATDGAEKRYHYQY